MKLSTDRILTTHVGSLPRPGDVAELLLKKEREEPFDEAELDARVRRGVAEIVARQVDAGVDVVSDGEMSKVAYSTYAKDRLTGFTGDSERRFNLGRRAVSGLPREDGADDRQSADAPSAVRRAYRSQDQRAAAEGPCELQGCAGRSGGYGGVHDVVLSGGGVGVHA